MKLYYIVEKKKCVKDKVIVQPTTSDVYCFSARQSNMPSWFLLFHTLSPRSEHKHKYFASGFVFNGNAIVSYTGRTKSAHIQLIVWRRGWRKITYDEKKILIKFILLLLLLFF